MQELDWSTLKQFISAKELSTHHFETDDYYQVYAFDNLIGFYSKLKKNDASFSADVTDFETNYKPTSNRKLTDANSVPLVRLMNAHYDDGLRVRHRGLFNNACPANSGTDMDWKIDQLNYWGQNVPAFMTGVQFKVVGGNDGDEIDFCVIDIDNILGYGANTPLDLFADKYYVYADNEVAMKEHMASLIPNLYIRAHYNNKGNNPATFICNLFRYIKTD